MTRVNKLYDIILKGHIENDNSFHLQDCISVFDQALAPNQQPPTLTIPQDTAQWNAMKKTLMVGGVYQVQMQDGRRKYCLWNGAELLPCE